MGTATAAVIQQFLARVEPQIFARAKEEVTEAKQKLDKNFEKNRTTYAT